MKKSYLMIAAAVALFTACAEKDTFKDVEGQEIPINFSQMATEKATRAGAELDMDWFHNTAKVGFGVYGFKGTPSADTKIFKNEQVTSTTASAPYGWTHSTIRFWDKAVNNYNFYAYAPFAGTNNSETSANPTFDYSKGFTFTGLSVIANIDVDESTTLSPDKVVATAVEGVGYTSNKLHTGGSYTDGTGTHSVADHANAPTVPFVFNHILSKLSFKIYTPVKPNNYETVAERVANFTVKSIKIDFPSATSVTWAETNKNSAAGETTYDTYAVKTGTKANDAFETTVYNNATGTLVPYSTTSADADEIGETFIVTPVNGTVKKHEFDVQVIYDVEYADGTSETGCIATGTIGTGDPAKQPGDTGYDPNIYAPGQNQYYVAIIKLDPAKIDFCVENVNAWDPNGQDLEDVEVK